jgi:large subunit ribosomal protein L10
MIQPSKLEQVEELAGLLKGSKCFILNDFTGLNVKDISELRRLCREKDVVYKVIKNTLAKRSLEKLGIEGMDDLLEGPTAVAVSDKDEIVAAQVLKEFANEYDLPKFKGGYIDGQIMDADETEKLASLPGREVLITQFVGTLQAPLRGFINCLDASLRELVNVLNAVSDKKKAS